ncbi:MAG: hypothetical protein JNK82_11815 [Myxococcaceae bacterium]|nr:hypothetical protein [Myxococcaceae bacterium]
MTSLVLLLALSASDTLVKASVSDLNLKLPQSKDWKSSEADENNGKSRTVVSADGDAQIELSVFAVSPRREAQKCVDELVKALGTEGYEATTVGGSPAFKKVAVDWVGEGEEAKKNDANKVNTVSYVGCNGRTKWLLSMTSKASKVARFGAVLKKVIESITYGGS